MLCGVFILFVRVVQGFVNTIHHYHSKTSGIEVQGVGVCLFDSKGKFSLSPTVFDNNPEGA